MNDPSITSCVVAVLMLLSFGCSSEKPTEVEVEETQPAAVPVVTLNPDLTDQRPATVEKVVVTGPRTMQVRVFVDDCTAPAAANFEIADGHITATITVGNVKTDRECGDPNLVAVELTSEQDLTGLGTTMNPTNGAGT